MPGSPVKKLWQQPEGTASNVFRFVILRNEVTKDLIARAWDSDSKILRSAQDGIFGLCRHIKCPEAFASGHRLFYLFILSSRYGMACSKFTPYQLWFSSARVRRIHSTV